VSEEDAQQSPSTHVTNHIGRKVGFFTSNVRSRICQTVQKEHSSQILEALVEIR
jgi:hypothetical protein